MYLIYQLSNNLVKDALRPNSPEPHHLISFLKTNKDISDVLLIFPSKAKQNANALQSEINKNSEVEVIPEETEDSFFDNDIDSKTNLKLMLFP